MRTEARFLKPDDYYNYTGKNLYKELQTNDNESNKVDLFIMYVEDVLLDYIEANSFRDFKWEAITSFQKEKLQRALIYQIDYIIRNGDLFTDSGYDVDKGFIADYNKIQAISICQPTINILVNSGLLNHKIRNRIRYLDI